jgi:hypothetical protein
MIRHRLAVCCLATCALLVALPAQAGNLADLGWDHQVPDDIRNGVRRALEQEVRSLSSEKNDAGEPYIKVWSNSYIEIIDGQPNTWLSIQRCLDDQMLVERWRYAFEKTGAYDYAVSEREKIFEYDGFVPMRTESPDEARPIEPFRFEHDLLTLEMDEGRYFLSYLGETPDQLQIAGQGRLRIEPLDDYQRMYFERRLDTPSLDTEITEISIDFHTSGSEFLELVGAEPLAEAGGAAGAGPYRRGLQDLYDRFMADIKGKEYTPYVYEILDDPEHAGYFTLHMKSPEHGWLRYTFNPAGATEIWFHREEKTATLGGGSVKQRWELVSKYQAPETRELSRLERDHRTGWTAATGVRHDARFDIAGDQFVGFIDAEILVRNETDHLGFVLAGNPAVRYVRDEQGRELHPIPVPNVYSTTYGFEETINYFRLLFDEPLEPGHKIRLSIAYESPRIVYKITDGFWSISRGGFLPFGGTLDDASFMNFVIRTDERYQHVSIGSKREEEIIGGHRYSRWSSKRPFNFPTLIIGQYYDLIEDEVDDIQVTGYMPKTGTQRMVVESNRALRPQVDQAVNSLKIFNRLLGVRYPFDEIKIMSAPEQFSWAQSPSSIVYVGEIFLMPPAEVANWTRANPTTFAGTTSHEVAHQWWGGLVTNVSQQHYWFVESFAELTSAYHNEAVDPGEGWNRSVRGWRKQTLVSDWASAVIDDMYHRENVPAQPLRYTKGPYVLAMLGEYYGYDKLKEYMRRVLELHSEDLIATVDLERAATMTFGEDMAWYFDQWIRDIGIPEVRYRIDGPRREGDEWVYDYELSQEVKVRGDTVPGKAFRLVVPVTATPPKGDPVKIKLPLTGAEDARSFRLPFKARKLEVNENDRMLMTVQRM